MKSGRARHTQIGLVQWAGPFAFMALVSTGLAAQDYIDVEAERRAAQAAPTTAPTGVVSYGVGGVSAATTTRSLPPPAAPASDNIGGLFNQVQQLQQEVMRLNGIVEQQAYELRTLKEQSLERYMDIDRRLAAGGGAASGATGSGSTAGAANGAGGAAVAPVIPPAGSQAAEQPGEGDAYRAAYALVRGQEFDQAVAAFTQFLQTYPDGRYAANAHYWLGELYLVIDPADPEASRQSFMLLLSQYPDNAKVPDALYKLGRVHFIKGNSQRSREYLERVMREYPDSSAARLAGDFIDQNL